MTHPRSTLWIAASTGAVLTLATSVLAAVLANAGYESAAAVIYWPNTLLQGMVPKHNIGTSETPIYEGTPLNFVAFCASFLLACVSYSAAATWLLRRRNTNA